MNNGYIKLWRKSLDGGWLSNHKLWTFWCWCLIKASYKEHDMLVGCQQIHLMPGDFIFGRKSAAKELKMSEQEIRTAVDSMRKRKNITIKSTNKYSIISIINWETYQSQELEINQQINQQLTINQPTTNHKQEVKNIKNKEYTSEFLAFFSAYPKHTAKEDAFKAWKQMNGSRPQIEEIIAAIESFKVTENWLKDNGKYIPLPATWLRGKRWEDEIDVNLGRPLDPIEAYLKKQKEIT